MSNPTTLTREQIEAKRAAALEKQHAENEQLRVRQETIHALAYKLHQEAHADENTKEKPGYDVSLEAATKLVDAAIAEAKAEAAAAQAKAEAAARAAADAKAAADAATADATAKEQAAHQSESAAHEAEAHADGSTPILETPADEPALEPSDTHA